MQAVFTTQLVVGKIGSVLRAIVSARSKWREFRAGRGSEGYAAHNFAHYFVSYRSQESCAD
jgi:hypothetical protein